MTVSFLFLFMSFMIKITNPPISKHLCQTRYILRFYYLHRKYVVFQAEGITSKRHFRGVMAWYLRELDKNLISRIEDSKEGGVADEAREVQRGSVLESFLWDFKVLRLAYRRYRLTQGFKESSREIIIESMGELFLSYKYHIKHNHTHMWREKRTCALEV